MVRHDRGAKTYLTLFDCESHEGDGRCERVDDRKYRGRLMAYHFTISDKIVAMPLYAQFNDSLFRDLDGKTYDWQRTEDVEFSEAAIVKVRNLAVFRFKKGKKKES